MGRRLTVSSSNGETCRSAPSFIIKIKTNTIMCQWESFSSGIIELFTLKLSHIAKKQWDLWHPTGPTRILVFLLVICAVKNLQVSAKEIANLALLPVAFVQLQPKYFIIHDLHNTSSMLESLQAGGEESNTRGSQVHCLPLPGFLGKSLQKHWVPH